jgi:hypothetical protein
MNTERLLQEENRGLSDLMAETLEINEFGMRQLFLISQTIQERLGLIEMESVKTTRKMDGAIASRQ